MSQPIAMVARLPQQPWRRPDREDEPPSSASRTPADREAEVRAVRRTLQAAGVHNAEIHAARLVEYREIEWAPEYTAASPHHQGSVAGAKDQLQLLRERLAEVQARLGARSTRSRMETPRAGNLDARWEFRMRREHPERFAQLDRDVQVARQNLSDAIQRGDKAALSGLRTAVDVTQHQVQRTAFAFRKGEAWTLFKAAHEAAPRLLAELEEREAALLPAEATSLRSAIGASSLLIPEPIREPEPNSEPTAAPSYGR